MAHIARMALMKFVGETKLRAAQTCPDLGHKFLKCVSLIAEALAEGARKAACMSAPMRLMPISA